MEKWLRMALAALMLAASTVVAAAGTPAQTRASAARESGGTPGLLASTEDGVSFSVPVPWDRLETEQVLAGASEYVRLLLPGWSATAEEGAPEMPSKVVSIGVPFGVELTVEAEVGPSRRVALPARVLPVATRLADWPAEALLGEIGSRPTLRSDVLAASTAYTREGMYPGAVAVVVSDGVVRRQRVVGVAVYPVQYDAGRQALVVYREVVVHVGFRGGAAPEQNAGAMQEDSAAFEGILRDQLLNYREARGWRSGGAVGTGTEGAPWAPPDPGYRILVKEEGIYRLTYAELQAAGLPVSSLDPQTFRLFNLGNEVAIRVPGEGDHKFDSADSILFYGQALTSKYSPNNVYWLTYGQAMGKRMTERDGTPGGAPVPAWYAEDLRMESNTYYLSILPGSEDFERFLWSYVVPPSVPSWSYSFKLAAPNPGNYAPGLEVSMFGIAISPGDPPPWTQILVNGVQVDDHQWTSGTWYLADVSLPPGLLVAGNNTLTIRSPNAQGVVYIDWADLQFEDAFVASNDVLKFGYQSPGTWQYEVNGFGYADVAAFDITDASAVVPITHTVVSPSGPSYKVSFQSQETTGSTYWVTNTYKYRHAYGIEKDTPSALGSAGNGADYIAITYAGFASQVVPLVNYRASRGLRAVLVDVQDVYDEFGYGISGAHAIHDFLDYAYHNWQQPSPAYVVLVGDGHYDPKNYLGNGRTSYMPPYLAPADPWIVETAADNRYVTVDGGDNFPDMIIGRLPANSAAEAQVMVNKTLQYEQTLAPADWRTNVLFVADNADSGGDFAATSDELIDCCLDPGHQANKVYYLVTHLTPTSARQAIINGINSGQFIVNYVGHAAASVWAAESLFSTLDIGSLANAAKLPIMLPMTCWEGYFIYPHATSGQSLGESLVRASGKGAVASWSPSGLGLAIGHSSLDDGFFEAVFESGVARLGEATLAGKLRLWSTGWNLDLIDTYVLFGDPDLQISPEESDLRVGKSVEPAGSVRAGGVLTYTLTFTNTGPTMAHGGVVTDIVPSNLLNPTVVFSSPEVLTQRAGVTFAWTLRNLLPGQSGEIRIRAVAPSASAPTSVKNEVRASASEPDPNLSNNTASVTTQIRAPFAVGRIALSYVPKGGGYVVSASTKILNAGGLGVQGAVVTAKWTLPNHSSKTQQQTSKANGVVSFSVASLLRGAYKICITNVTKQGWFYDPSRNRQTCGTVVVP